MAALAIGCLFGGSNAAQHREQLPFFGIGKWNPDAAVTVFDNSVRNVCLQGLFHQQAVGCQLHPVASMRVARSRNPPGFDFHWRYPSRDPNQVIGLTGQTMAVRHQGFAARERFSHIGRDNLSVGQTRRKPCTPPITRSSSPSRKKKIRIGMVLGQLAAWQEIHPEQRKNQEQQSDEHEKARP